MWELTLISKLSGNYASAMGTQGPKGLCFIGEKISENQKIGDSHPGLSNLSFVFLVVKFSHAKILFLMLGNIYSYYFWLFHRMFSIRRTELILDPVTSIDTWGN